jgi:hypothetical protein
VSLEIPLRATPINFGVDPATSRFGPTLGQNVEILHWASPSSTARFISLIGSSLADCRRTNRFINGSRWWNSHSIARR